MCGARARANSHGMPIHAPPTMRRALLQWYKLDAREAAIEEELFSIGPFA